MNDLLGRTSNSTNVNELKVNDISINSPNEIVEAFNTYFSNIGTNLATEMASPTITFEQFLKP